MIKEKSDRFASTSSATSSTTDSVAAVSITPPPTTTTSPTTPGTTGTVTLSQSAPDGAINSSALSKSPGTTSTGGGSSSGQSPSATKATINNNSSNATGINTTNSSTVPNNTASGVSPQSSSSSSSNSNTKHSPTHQLSNKEKDGQSSTSLMPTIKDEPISSDSLMGNGEDMCALQADQIKRESDSGSNTTQSSTTLSTTGSVKDSSSLNSRLSKNGVGAANSGIIGSTNTGSVAGGYEKGNNRSPLSEGKWTSIVCNVQTKSS